VAVEAAVRPLVGNRVAVEVTVRNDSLLPTNATERGLVGQP
jgi:hypothetical protein